jgi:putative transposase
MLVPKVGWVAVRRSRNLPEWKSYRVTRDRAGRWHVAFAVIPDPVPAPGTGEIMGVDRGVKAAAARLKARQSDRRKDWVEKTSTDLARRFDVIRVEDLNVTAMTRSAKGTTDTPGRHVRAKAGLNRGILAAGWSLLVTRLEQKAPGRVEKINPAYTSQTCNACQHVAAASRQSQAVFRCVACGHQANADVNAARNIRDREPTAVGRTVAARGDRAKSARSVKREPQRARPPKVA